MENNFSDKHMRDKLKGVEVPYDPQAWEQMNAMLDKSEKRRGFFWWWFGGAAAAILLLAGGLGYHEFAPHGLQLSANQAPVSGLPSTVNASPSPVYNPKVTVSNPQTSSTVTKAKLYHSSPQVNTGNQHGNSTETSPIKREVQNQGVAMQSGINKAATLNKNKIEKALAKLNRGEKNENSKQQADPETAYLVDPSSVSEATVLETAITRLSEKGSNSPAKSEESGTTTDNGQQTEISIEPVSAWLNTILPEHKMEKKNENVDLPKRKKIFVYSMGVIVNTTGAFTSTADKPAFFGTPSYAIGFTHEFMFWKRFAITNALEFSQTSFRVNAPKTLNYPVAPNSFTSKIIEVAIPIGLKVYPVSNKKIRFYIQAGFINHIKLKESFTYSVPPPVSHPLFYPAQTTFGGGHPSTYNSMASPTGSASLTEPPGTSDFSINYGRRYYASFYTSAGVEYIVKSHFVFFAEPVFDMTLNKIGVQDKRKYNLGLSAGFRYQF